jgi:hypothetical protein
LGDDKTAAVALTGAQNSERARQFQAVFGMKPAFLPDVMYPH